MAPARASKVADVPSRPTVASQTLVIDNGGYTIKAGYATADSECRIIPNCIAKGREGRGSHIYIADQLNDCKDFAEMAFRRPIEKGYVTNWDLQLDIWKEAFFKPGDSSVVPEDTNLIYAESPNCPLTLQKNCDEILFEEVGFASVYRCVGSALNAYNDVATLMGESSQSNTPAECILVVNSGYTQTTVTPVLYGRPVHSAIRRLDLGGKQLTNYLKELISLRHFSIMDEPHLASQIKEDACFVSHEFKLDLDCTWKATTKHKSSASDATTDIIQEYVLPDYVNTHRGHLRPYDPARHTAAAKLARSEEIFALGNERFVVPELMFSPSDIGMAQAGLPEVVVQSLSTLPVGLWPGMLANVVVVGGNAKLPGFVQRLEDDLRALTPADCMLRVRYPEEPITSTWQGGVRLGMDSDRLRSLAVTKQEYEEHGSAWTLQRFASGLR